MIQSGGAPELNVLSSNMFNINYDSARGGNVGNSLDAPETEMANLKQQSLHSLEVRSSLISSSNPSVSLVNADGQTKMRRPRKKYIITPPQNEQLVIPNTITVGDLND